MDIQVRPLTVGPIVGHTRTHSARIWGRGHFEQTEDGPLRCFGALRFRQAGDSDYSPPQFFRLLPNFDMTGVLVLEGLDASTSYECQVGWFFRELEPESLDPGWNYDWSEANIASFRTASEGDDESRTFVFGSCRYLLRLFGGSWFDDRGDKAFRSILEQIDGGKPIDLFLMVGDQIYADDLGNLSPDQTADQFLRRYREVFTQPQIRALMSRVPTYMTLDDHEIEDDWPARQTAEDLMVKYPSALHAYLCYQASHSPLFETRDGRLVGTPDKLWYAFRDGCCDFFVTDSRTERHLSDDPAEREILNQIQMDALKSWLSDGSGRVKLVVSSVPVFPDKKRPSEDKWVGFPRQRTELLEFIRQEAIRRVVFLSGDVHVAMSTELVSPSDPDFKIVSLISSAFFWPYPNAKGREYSLEGEVPTEADTVYRLRRAGPVFRQNNFTRVQADLDKVRVQVYDRKGDLLKTKTHTF